MCEIVYQERNGIKFSDETKGASDHSACLTRRGSVCRCQPKCRICGWGEHAALHGPLYGAAVDSKPWAHKFLQPAPVAEDRQNLEAKDGNSNEG